MGHGRRFKFEARLSRLACCWHYFLLGDGGCELVGEAFIRKTDLAALVLTTETAKRCCSF